MTVRHNKFKGTLLPAYLTLFLICVFISAMIVIAICLFDTELRTNTEQTASQYTMTATDARVIDAIINKKDMIRYEGDNAFSVGSIYMFTNHANQTIRIHIWGTSFNKTISCNNLMKLLNEIQADQRVLREKDDQERIMKAIAELE